MATSLKVNDSMHDVWVGGQEVPGTTSPEEGSSCIPLAARDTPFWGDGHMHALMQGWLISGGALLTSMKYGTP